MLGPSGSMSAGAATVGSSKACLTTDVSQKIISTLIHLILLLLWTQKLKRSWVWMFVWWMENGHVRYWNSKIIYLLLSSMDILMILWSLSILHSWTASPFNCMVICSIRQAIRCISALITRRVLYSQILVYMIWWKRGSGRSSTGLVLRKWWFLMDVLNHPTIGSKHLMLENTA